ncbi:hypothetical protein Droror1_Dr00012821 [Drosera rotundifolia]
MSYYSYDYYETGSYGPDSYPYSQGQLHRPASAYTRPPQNHPLSKPGDVYRLQSQGNDVNTVTVYQQPQPSPFECDDPFGSIIPSSFPPGTDPKIIESFNRIDKNGDGMIDDVELQTVLSSFSSFNLRTVHLLMYLFTNSNSRMIGPREFVPLYKNLQNWRAIFQRSDLDRNGRIDAGELRTALGNLGYTLPPMVLSLLISKFDKSKGNCSIGFDNFIECCLTVKGLTEKFKAKENSNNGTACFTYDEFLLGVLPFIIA